MLYGLTKTLHFKNFKRDVGIKIQQRVHVLDKIKLYNLLRNNRVRLLNEKFPSSPACIYKLLEKIKIKE